MRKKKVIAVIFDLGRVLVKYDARLPCEALSRYSLLSADDIHEALNGEEGRKLLRRPYEAGALTCAQFYDAVCARVSLRGVSPADFPRLWADICGPTDDIEEVLDSIRPDVAKGIISNIDPPNWQKTTVNHFIARHFVAEHCMLSFRERRRKPDEELFRIAARRLNLDPHRIVYVDDVEANVAAAKAVGFKAHRFDCLEQPTSALATILDRYGLLTA